MNALPSLIEASANQQLLKSAHQEIHELKSENRQLQNQLSLHPGEVKPLKVANDLIIR